MPHAPFLAGMVSDADRLNVLHDYGTYTPELRAATTDPNLGSTGEAEGFWYRRGHYVNGFARFRAGGTGITQGSGILFVKLPFLPDPAFNTLSSTGGAGTLVGSGKVRDGATAANSRIVFSQMTDVIPPSGADQQWLVMQRIGSNNTITATAPAPIASDWALSLNFGYLADPASLGDVPVNDTGFTDGEPLFVRPVRNLDSYQTYTPQLLGSTTNPNLGEDGEAVGWYHRSGRWVDGFARFLLRNPDIAIGSGQYRVTLPVPVDLNFVQVVAGHTNGYQLGDGRIRDASTPGNSSLVVCQIPNGVPGTSLAMTYDSTNGNVDQANPFTWASNDRISIRFFYPADPAALT